MNCFILLLLLSCCGWGNGRACNDCGVKPCGCRREPMGKFDRGCCDRRDDCMQKSGCGERREERIVHEECCCEEDHRRAHHDHDDCGCSEGRDGGCENPGMIPPPWQDYPRFPRRDNGEDCDA